MSISVKGFVGNTVVDQEATGALDDPISNCSIPYTDFKPFIMKYILKRWQDSWNQQIHDKLHEIHSIVGKTNNWNYTEYIPVVPHYLIDNDVLIYYV
jgi:hypothetical protein